MSEPLHELIKAHLNLYAVLQNLEDLVRLDSEAADRVRTWDVSINFSVLGGPEATLAFRNGQCTHVRGSLGTPDIRLFFYSPKHLNAMFDNKANPIPLRGFKRLGFLKNEFTPLTKRLEHFLKPQASSLTDANYVKLNTTLTLQTAFFAAGELARLEPVSKHVAARMGSGAVQAEVLPDGPCAHLMLNGGITAHKDRAARPMARMIFRDMKVANDMLNDRLEAFQAVVREDIMLRGRINMVENLNLILDRIRLYMPQ